jgi:DNA polymerase elongation subunit (family B)
MGWNISPEVKVEMDPHFPGLQSILDQYAVIEDHGYSYAANGVKFKKDKQGFLAALMEKMFIDRSDYKKKMLEAKQELELIDQELRLRQEK